VTAYRHLHALGHQRIALLVGPSCYTPVLRKIAGFEAAAAAAGETVDPDLVVETIFTLDGGYTGAQRLLDAGATGIVAASDMMALGAVRAARERGMAVPDDVSIVGYDDTELMRFTDPPLTTVHQPVTRIVEYAVDALLAQIRGEPVDTAERRISGELIVRGTTTRSPAHRRAPIG
jgi:DNA-binding LacI/PurR family transcriptional regulator